MSSVVSLALCNLEGKDFSKFIVNKGQTHEKLTSNCPLWLVDASHKL